MDVTVQGDFDEWMERVILPLKNGGDEGEVLEAIRARLSPEPWTLHPVPCTLNPEP